MTDLFDAPFEEEDEPDIPAPETPARERHIFSVSELTQEIRALLESRYAQIWVEGEISNCKVWNTTGHL